MPITLDYDYELLNHIIDPNAWVTISGENFSEELIEDDFVRDIFLWQKSHLRQHKQIASPAVLNEEFGLDNSDFEFEKPETAIGDLIDRLRERYAKNRSRDTFKRLEEGYKNNPSSISQILLQEGRKLSSVLSKNGEVYGTGDIHRAKSKYEVRANLGKGPSLGYKEIDDYVFGQRGITFVMGTPKSGKSWQMIQSVKANIEQKRNVWLYSLELPAEETDMRLRCLMADVPWWKYLRSAMTNTDWKKIEEASERMDELGSYKIVKPPRGERKIEEMVERAIDAGVDSLYIDQLQYIEADSGGTLGEHNSTGLYWGVLDKARDLSDTIPICFAHQFNRNGSSSTDSMPDITTAKGSSAIEETATLALGIWANKDMRRNNVAELGILISRNYIPQRWELNVELSRGCHFDIIDRIDDDSE